jgi:hypothetical protein
MKRILVLAAVTIVILGLTAPTTFAGRPTQQQKQQKESLNPTITLPSGKVINAPILKYLPSEDGWLTDIDEGLKLAQKENKKVILLFALVFRNNHGMTKGYLATHYVEQPQFKEAVKDKYILVYYWQDTITPELKTKYNISRSWQMDMLILDQNGKELAREQKPGPDVNYLINFVNSVQ